VLDSPFAALCSVDVSPDGSHLASLTTGGTVRVIDVETGAVRTTWQNMQVRNIRVDGSKVVFSPDGTLLASTHRGHACHATER
jgi:WD40 repeat protein